MSVSLNPSNALGFRRPLTTLVKRSLTITNNNAQPVAFKVKTTAPKLYCVRPNSGRVEPGESLDVSVMLQALKEEPPINTKCKDKFLIQSTIITPDKETLALHDIWASPDANDEGKVFQQKLRVTYLPAEGQTLEEEDELAPPPSELPSMMSSHDSYDTVRPAANGHLPNLASVLASAPTAESQLDVQTYEEEERPHTPINDAIDREASHYSADTDVPAIHEPLYPPPSPSPPPAMPIPEPIPEVDSDFSREPPAVHEPESAPTPVPAHVPVPAPVPIIIHQENPVNEQLFAKFKAAELEIESLRAQVTALSIQPPQELRRRRRTSSENGSATGSDVQIMVEDAPLQQEGVPLQVVVIIALGVFVTTYLFF